MNRWGYIGLAIIVVVIGVYLYRIRHDLGFGSGSPDAGQSAVSSSLDSRAHPGGILWQKLDRTADGFKIDMPANFQQTQVPAYNEYGGTEQANMLYANPDPQICYSITWEEEPPVERVNGHVPDKTLEMALKDAINNSKTTLISKAEVSQQGFPARDFSARNAGGGVMTSRLVLARHRLYMLTVAYPSAEARNDKDLDHFFNSFSVVVPGHAN